MEILFGDKVKVLATEQTQSVGLAGKTGEVLGETRPSATGVNYFGEANDDYVVNVEFSEMNQEYWLSPDLLELLTETENEQTSWQTKSQQTKKWWQIWK